MKAGLARAQSDRLAPKMLRTKIKSPIELVLSTRCILGARSDTAAAIDFARSHAERQSIQGLDDALSLVTCLAAGGRGATRGGHPHASTESEIAASIAHATRTP